MSSSVQYGGNGNTDIIQLLIDSGADTTTALAHTCSNENYDVCHLFVQSGVELNTISYSQLYQIHETSLHMISRRFSGTAWRICELLILAGADIDPICNDVTPLMVAVIQGHISTVQYLLQHKANFNYQQTTGTTCLHHAARLGKLDICELLYTYVGNVHAVDILGPVHEIRGNPIIEDFLDRKLIELNQMFKRARTDDTDDKDKDKDKKDNN